MFVVYPDPYSQWGSQLWGFPGEKLFRRTPKGPKWFAIRALLMFFSSCILGERSPMWTDVIFFNRCGLTTNFSFFWFGKQVLEVKLQFPLRVLRTFPTNKNPFLHKALGSMELVYIPTDVSSSKQKHHLFNAGNDFQACNHSFKWMYIYIHISYHIISTY